MFHWCGWVRASGRSPPPCVALLTVEKSRLVPNGAGFPVTFWCSWCTPTGLSGGRRHHRRNNKSIPIYRQVTTQATRAVEGQHRSILMSSKFSGSDTRSVNREFSSHLELPFGAIGPVDPTASLSAHVVSRVFWGSPMGRNSWGGLAPMGVHNTSAGLRNAWAAAQNRFDTPSQQRSCSLRARRNTPASDVGRAWPLSPEPRIYLPPIVPLCRRQSAVVGVNAETRQFFYPAL